MAGQVRPLQFNKNNQIEIKMQQIEEYLGYP